MKKPKHSSPTTHTEFVSKTFCKLCHSFKMLFIALYMPAIILVFI